MLVDPTRLSNLSEEVGADVFEDVIEMSVEELDEAVADLDPPTAAKLHFLKGSALNCGLQRFSDLCAEGEQHLKRDERAEIDTSAIRKLYFESRQELLAQSGMTANVP